jgi:hypothetical protein
MIDLTKHDLMLLGRDLMTRFCAANNVPEPAIELAPSNGWAFGVCAYYRRSKINLCLAKCAPIGLAGASWSYPGYTVDRTPYGVIQHELGHHVDVQRSQRVGPYFGDFSIGMRKTSGEEPITSYCENDYEWFAEMFRLFVTNPDLLSKVRPRTYAAMRDHFEPVVTETWEQVLVNAPDRTIKQAGKKVAEAQPKQQALL